MRLLLIACLLVGAWALAIGFVWLAVRIAGGPHAWKFGLALAAVGVVGGLRS